MCWLKLLAGFSSLVLYSWSWLIFLHKNEHHLNDALMYSLKRCYYYTTKWVRRKLLANTLYNCMGDCNLIRNRCAKRPGLTLDKCIKVEIVTWWMKDTQIVYSHSDTGWHWYVGLFIETDQVSASIAFQMKWQSSLRALPLLHRWSILTLGQIKPKALPIIVFTPQGGGYCPHNSVLKSSP